MSVAEWTPILSGVVGSQAHGTAGPDSDVDTMTVALAPTMEFLGLHPPVGKAATRVTNDPDTVTHEAGKFAALALKCNPSILELLFLPESEYTVIRHPYAAELLIQRGAFLSRKTVRNAYLGYANAQFAKLRARDDGTFSSDVRNRTAKHARHLARLLGCGAQLYATGTMSVRVADPQELREFGDAVADGGEMGLTLASRRLDHYEEVFDRTVSPLPESPDERTVEWWLRSVRRMHLS